MLTDEEAQEYAYNIGTIGFVDYVANTISFDTETMPEDDWDVILDAIDEISEPME